MADTEYENQIKKLQIAIENISPPLMTLATIKLAEEFYSKDDRMKLYTEYSELIESDQTAHKNLEDAEPTHDKDLGWGERVRKYGENVAQEHLNPRTKAQAERTQILKRLDEFREKHPLIAQLVEARNH